MKNSSSLIFLIVLLFFSCKNENPKSPKKEQTTVETTAPSPIPTPQKVDKNIPLPSQKEGVDYWTANNCTRAFPEKTIRKEHQYNGYDFKLNLRQGYGKETMFLENGYKLDVTSKGCNSIILTYSYFLPASDLDISNEENVAQKVLELIDMTAKISNPIIDLSSKYTPLKQHITHTKAFKIKEEFSFSDSPKNEKFSLERLETKNNKVFLVYSFSADV